MSDGKTCYSNVNGAKRYFIENNQPEGWKLHVFRNTAKVARLSRVVNDRVIMSPQWEKLRFTVEYVAGEVDNADEIMEPTVVNFGVSTPLRENVYKRKGFWFIRMESISSVR